MEVSQMASKFKISREMVNQLEYYEYDEMIKLAAILKIIQEDGLTPEIIQKWGTYYKGKHVLQIPLCKKKEEVVKNGHLPNFETKQVLIEIP